MAKQSVDNICLQKCVFTRKKLVLIRKKHFKLQFSRNLFGGFGGSVYFCKSGKKNILITYAPRKSLERSDSALLFRLLDRASEAATESGRGGLRIRPLIEWEGRRSRQGSGEGTPQRGFGGRAPYQNTRYKFCMPSLSPTKIRDDQG